MSAFNASELAALIVVEEDVFLVGEGIFLVFVEEDILPSTSRAP